MSEIIHKRQEDEGGDSFGDDDSFLRGITVSFSWDYPDDFSLKDVQDTAFFVYDDSSKPRSESQHTCDCIQDAGAGVLLLKPHPEIKPSVTSSLPSEIHFTPNRPEYLIRKLTVVSESRHLELYIDSIYEMTAKGCALSLKKGSKPALYECQFELPNHFQSSQKLGIKFLSLGDRNTVRLQAVIVQVVQQKLPSPAMPMMPNQLPLLQQGVPSIPGNSNLDIGGVREMLQSMGLNVPSKADQLMNDIEHQQKQLQMTQLQGLANVGLMAQLQTLTHQQQTLQQQNQSVQFIQAMFNPAAKPNTNTPSTNGHGKSSVSSTRGSSRSASPRLTDGHRSPESKYPLFRETVNPPESSLRRAVSTSTIKSQSVGSFDHYNGFGTSHPSTDSILQTAIQNEEEARQLARKRASHIEEQNVENNNYEKTQIEMVKSFLRSGDPSSRKLTITKLPPKPARGRPQKRGDADRKPRPHSMSALPTASEVDFTKLLSEMMHEETDGYGEEKATIGPDANNARWSAYLRSRVRASQRFSSSASSNYPSSDALDDVISPSESCPTCGCHGCNATLNKMQKEIQGMEARLSHQMQTQMSNLQQHLDSRIDQMYSMMMGNFFNVEPTTSAV